MEKEGKDVLKVMEGWRREVVITREWQELEPRTVQTVEACKGFNETELSFEPGALITGVRPASQVEDDVCGPSGAGSWWRVACFKMIMGPPNIMTFWHSMLHDITG